MPKISETVGRHARRAIQNAVAESNYGGGNLFAPVEYKADPEDEADGFLKPKFFEGFANVGGPDLGGDIVEPSAFSRDTLNEYLKFGRQLFFMHDRMSQVGEIVEANQVKKGTRSKYGITEGGLYVAGFVDSPFDEETGMIPDHPLAKIIHFARMQVNRNRLKLLSIGWRPVKTELVKREDPRRGGEISTFRLVKKLILGEISLVTMAMSPQSMVELRKAYRGAYGEDITDALFAEEEGDAAALRTIPEKVDGLTFDYLRELAARANVAAALKGGAGNTEAEDDDDDEETTEGPKLNLVSLRDSQPDADNVRLNLVSLNED